MLHLHGGVHGPARPPLPPHLLLHLHRRPRAQEARRGPLSLPALSELLRRPALRRPQPPEELLHRLSARGRSRVGADVGGRRGGGHLGFGDHRRWWWWGSRGDELLRRVRGDRPAAGIPLQGVLVLLRLRPEALRELLRLPQAYHLDCATPCRAVVVRRRRARAHEVLRASRAEGRRAVVQRVSGVGVRDMLRERAQRAQVRRVSRAEGREDESGGAAG